MVKVVCCLKKVGDLYIGGIQFGIGQINWIGTQPKEVPNDESDQNKKKEKTQSYKELNRIEITHFFF